MYFFIAINAERGDSMLELFRILGTISITNKEAIDVLGETADEAEKSSGKMEKAFGKVAGVVGKAAVAATSAAATAVGAITKTAVTAYADYEQLVGGVDTLFKDSSDKVQKYASKAFQTAGLSANQYMETVTSFSASLLQSLENDTEAAAEYADMAIIDMSDNANKMGTSMESIQNAYQGFAKQNYTMLDNLKLGYGGTKGEMERLIKNANRVKVANGQMADLSIESFADVTEAIHIIQTEMGITGTTALEASDTIQGSVAAMKAAWKNMLVGIADGNQDIGVLMKNLGDSIITVGNNLLPRIKTTIEGIAQLIKVAVPPLIEQVVPMIIDILPELLDAAVTLVVTFVQSAVKAITGAIGKLVTSGLNAIKPKVKEFFKFMADDIKGRVNSIKTAVKNGFTAVKNAIVNPVKSAYNSVKSAFSNLHNTVKSKVNSAKSTVKNGFKNIKSNIVTPVKSAYNSVKDYFLRIYNNVKNKVNSAKSTAKSGFNKVKEYITSPVKSAYNTVKSKFSDIYNAIVNKIAAARDKVKGIVDKIKGFFNFTVQLPHIKLPHFSITPAGWKIGDLLQGVKPELGISWYAKAMDNPMVMTSPTIFGYNAATGQLMGGGEAGSEVVSGTDTLMQMISEAVATQNASLAFYLQKLVEMLAEFCPQMLGSMDRQLVLDTGVLVGEIASPMDKALGKLKERKDRGR